MTAASRVLIRAAEACAARPEDHEVASLMEAIVDRVREWRGERAPSPAGRPPAADEASGGMSGASDGRWASTGSVTRCSRCGMAGTVCSFDLCPRDGLGGPAITHTDGSSMNEVALEPGWMDRQFQSAKAMLDALPPVMREQTVAKRNERETPAITHTEGSPLRTLRGSMHERTEARLAAAEAPRRDIEHTSPTGRLEHAQADFARPMVPRYPTVMLDGHGPAAPTNPEDDGA